MNSIRTKLFIQMGGIILFFITFMFIVNTTLLESYYTNIQKEKLTDFYTQINDMDSNSFNSYTKDFVEIETVNNIDIIITKSSGQLLYSTNRRDKELKEDRNPFQNKNLNPPQKNFQTVEEVSDNVQLLWTYDAKFNHQLLMLQGTLDSGDNIEMMIPYASIKNSISLFNNFLLIIGLITLIIALLSVYILSGHFTGPILEINKITGRMKRLDFNKKCNVRTRDEIGQLAESINELSNELSRSIESLKDVADKRKTLLNDVSHELKTPLALMQGYAEGLKRGIAQSEEKRDFYCDVILDETKNMTKLVEGLLNLDELDQGTIKLDISTYKINDQIENIYKKFTEIMDEKDIVHSLTLSAEQLVEADSFRIERVFTNYITNAVNYVDDRLKIDIKVENREDAIRVSIFNSAKDIVDEDLERIWDNFYKIDKARSRETGGHGLGLSIVKAIQELHGSKYGVKKVVDGVVFWFDVKRSNT